MCKPGHPAVGFELLQITIRSSSPGPIFTAQVGGRGADKKIKYEESQMTLPRDSHYVSFSVGVVKQWRGKPLAGRYLPSTAFYRTASILIELETKTSFNNREWRGNPEPRATE